MGEISKADSEKEDANFRNVGQKQLSSSSKAGTSLVFVVLNFQQKLLFHLSPSWQTPHLFGRSSYLWLRSSHPRCSTILQSKVSSCFKKNHQGSGGKGGQPKALTLSKANICGTGPWIVGRVTFSHVTFLLLSPDSGPF